MPINCALKSRPAPASWRHLGALSVLLALGWPAVALASAELDLTWGQPSWAAPALPATSVPLALDLGAGSDPDLLVFIC